MDMLLFYLLVLRSYSFLKSLVEIWSKCQHDVKYKLLRHLVQIFNVFGFLLCYLKWRVEM